MLPVLLACTPDPSGVHRRPDHPTDTDTATVPTPTPTSTTLVLRFREEPRVVPNPATNVSPVARVVAGTNQPTRLTVVLDDGVDAKEIAFPDLATDHDVPLLGLLSSTAYTVTATFANEAGEHLIGDLAFTSDAAFEPIPNLTVLVAEPDRMEPGYTVFPADIVTPSVIYAVDGQGRVVWSFRGSSGTARAVAFDPETGTFAALLGSVVSRFTADGTEVQRFSSRDDDPTAVPLPFTIHHDAAFEPDGSFWTWHDVNRDVASYPTTEDDPTITAPATVSDAHVVHFAADGSILDEWSMADRLDEDRIGYDSLDGLTPDWAHGNAIVPMRAEGRVIVSLRHQDAVVSLGLPDGDVQWILANHDGWDPSLAPLLLEPVGRTFGWPYHQHAPMVGAGGTLWMFDNGNGHRTTPYSETPEPGEFSRLVGYRVDEIARTVSQHRAHTGPAYTLFSQALGNCDELPLTGNLLGTFAYLHKENNFNNSSNGLGENSARLIEVDLETDDIVFDLRLNVDVKVAASGLLTDRATRVPTLYGPGVTVRDL